MKKKHYVSPMVIKSIVILEDSITNCSVCLIPEGPTNDILIEDYQSDSETENIYF